MTTTIAGHIRAGTVEEIKTRGCTVVTGGGHAIAVFHHDGELFAVDNRCPHMGFPLDRGSVKDGILTCHCITPGSIWPAAAPSILSPTTSAAIR